MNIFEREKEKENDREEFLISLIFSKKKNTKKTKLLYCCDV